MLKLLIDGKSLTIDKLVQVAFNETTRISLTTKSKKQIRASRLFVENRVFKKQDVVYGVNTGFGLLSHVRIANNQLDQLQVNLLRSHAVGVGNPLSIPEVRAAILLRANTLASGFSGVTLELVESLLSLLNKGVHPWIPEKGSVGACGDLAPLAHLALVLIGEGKAYYKNKLMRGDQALKAAGLKPYSLKAKEGLSLINGTQIMTAIGALAWHKANRLAKMADTAAAMTLEALSGSQVPFDNDIHLIRPHKGQLAVAANFRKLLSHSEIMKHHENCGKVQDPYSLRCIPQVHGIVRDTLENTEKVLAIEINSVTDNPLVFKNKNKIVSGGNFHGEYVAIAMDSLAIAIAELANISEQRLQKLINPAFSELPPFLIEDSGLNSGFMIIQVAAASLVSENKVLAHPASVDSIPTSADKEDHVSMGTISARKCREIVDNTWNVIAMEFFTASQGLEFRKPLRPAKALIPLYNIIRSQVSFAKKDRAFHIDIEKISMLMNSGKLSI